LQSGAGSFHAGASETFSREVIVIAPNALSSAWQNIRIATNASGKPIGDVAVRVQVVQWSLPQ
jgi:hypothetical protein